MVLVYSKYKKLKPYHHFHLVLHLIECTCSNKCMTGGHRALS